MIKRVSQQYVTPIGTIPVYQDVVDAIQLAIDEDCIVSLYWRKGEATTYGINLTASDNPQDIWNNRILPIL